jgi:hypothetical protein
MKTACYVLALAILTAGALCASAADEALDLNRVRQLHQKVQSGQQLTPEEQAYYERGKGARRNGRTDEQPSKDRAGDSAPPALEAKTSTGCVPLCDMMADDRYKGEDGGLYSGGRNTPPEAHLKAALAEAAKMQPLGVDGQPSPSGKIVLLTHGMSATTMESQQFIKLANADPRKSPAVLLVDGAQGGIDARKWVEDTHTRRGESPWDRLGQRIKSAGGTPQQVQVLWMKHAIAMKNDRRVRQFGEFPKHAQQLKDDMAEILRMLKQRYPNSPRFEVHPNSYEPVTSYDHAPVAHVSIHASQEYPSKLLLPEIAP